MPRPVKFKPLIPSEDSDCEAFAKYLRIKKLRFSHINNESPAVRMVGRQASGKPIWKKNFKTLARNEAMGVNGGVPDYIILIERKATEKAGARNSTLLFIEMKREKGGVVSPEQADWINALNNVFGCVAVVCRGFDQAKETVDAFINN
jgi:hypothetical protein